MNKHSPAAMAQTQAALTSADAGTLLRLLDAGALDALVDIDTRARLHAAIIGEGHLPPVESSEPDEAQIAARENPMAVVLALNVDRRGHRTVTVSCPLCEPSRSGRPRTHIHGWPDGIDLPMHRVAHCSGRTVRGRGYYIVSADADPNAALAADNRQEGLPMNARRAGTPLGERRDQSDLDDDSADDNARGCE